MIIGVAATNATQNRGRRQNGRLSCDDEEEEEGDDEEDEEGSDGYTDSWRGFGLGMSLYGSGGGSLVRAARMTADV